MKEIRIKNAEDFQQLESLTGNDYIVLTLTKELKLKPISAISLQNFRGTIHVSLEDPLVNYVFRIRVSDVKKVQYFFENLKDVNVIFPKTNNIKFFYQSQKKVFNVRSGEELKKALKVGEKHENIHIYLKNDVVLSYVPRSVKNLSLHGEGYTLYGRKELISSLDFLSSNEFHLEQVFLQEIDAVISIRKMEDFQGIWNFQNKRVVLSMDRDFSNGQWQPLDFSKFYGTIILLGNGRTLQDVTLCENYLDSLGLISNLALGTDFICSDLTVRNLKTPVRVRENLGVFLGSRESAIAPYYVMPGKTLFKRCHVFNTYLERIAYTVGAFAGNIDEFAECIDCSFNGGFIFGNQHYYDWNSLDRASNALGIKRICFAEEDIKKLERKK